MEVKDYVRQTPSENFSTYKVTTTVKYVPSDTILFSESVSAPYVVGRRGRWYLSSPKGNKLQIWRKLDGDKKPPPGKKVRVVDEPEGLVDKMKELYKKLSEPGEKGYLLIANRVLRVLHEQRAKK